MKICKDCGAEKPLDEYHKHNRMKDGHLNKCKQCVCDRVKRHRGNNLEKIQAYDRARGNRQPDGYGKEYRDRYPKKYKAQTMINNAIRDGKIKKMPCETCGDEKSCGHHDDYAYPLSVRWLCQSHHKQWHAIHGEGLNGI